MKLLHPVSNGLLLSGKAVLLMSGLVFTGQFCEAWAQTPHHHGLPKSKSHKKHMGKTAHKHIGKRNGKTVLKKHKVVPSVKMPLAAGAVAGAAAGAVSAKTMQSFTLPAQSVQPEQEKGTDTGFPIPRFASLRADRVYMRRGPGDRYPIDWVYHRRGLPVKIEREFDVWRLVEDSNGQKGWVHRVTLRGNRTFVVMGNEGNSVNNTKNSFSKHADPYVIGYVPAQEINHQKGDYIYLLSSAGVDQRVKALLKAGVVGQITNCPHKSALCHVKVVDYEGWVPRKYIWGLFPEEIIETK